MGGRHDHDSDLRWPRWREPRRRAPCGFSRIAVGTVMRRGAWVGLGVALLVLASPFLLTAPLPTGNLVEVRDRFEPQGYETVTDGRVEPRRIFCLGDNACPSAHVLWTFATPFTTDELQQWLDDAGYQATVDGDCAIGRCSASGTAGGWRLAIYGSTAWSSSGEMQLSLSLKN